MGIGLLLPQLHGHGFIPLLSHRHRPRCRLPISAQAAQQSLISSSQQQPLSGWLHSKCISSRCHLRSLHLRRPFQQPAAKYDKQAQPTQPDERPVPPDDEQTPEASTSGRDADSSWDSDDETEGLGGLEGVPLFAAGMPGVSDVKRQWKKWEEKIFYEEILPPTGSQQLSYAGMLRLLQEKRIKRIILLDEGRIGIVEIPVEGFSGDFDTMKFDKQDESIVYMDEQPEWNMEKFRYYVELPGDMWEDGHFMTLIHRNQPYRGRDNRVPYDMLLQEGQCNVELVVIDQSSQNAWLNQYGRQFVPIFALLALRGVVGVGQLLNHLFGKKKKDPMQELADELGAHKAKEFNVGLNPKQLGIKYEDVAGIDKVKDDIKVAMDMLMGAPAYRAIGAKPYRGILLEGPPGTGKTYLAKAMASEGGVPFFSANGAEFVEMFQGVAASRIRSLFRAARKVSPSIVFIDEIDAIGKARGSGSDPGSQEREQGLLQLLTEMDGFKRDDQVLVVGATNRAAALDDALLRPGRFDRQIYMGYPSMQNRFRILQVHSRNKPIDRSGDDQHESDALLHKVAELAIGYSGAELANLMNESAILAVRRNQSVIDLRIVLEAMEKIRLGLRQSPLPPSDAKAHLATLAAARAVVLAMTPGLPPVEHVTILPRGGIRQRILFKPMESGLHGNQLHELYYAAKGPDGRHLNSFEFSARLLVPLYAARAAEEVIYGPEGMTLSTAGEVAEAGQLAHWLVRNSTLHPSFRNPMMYSMIMGGHEDPTTRGLEPTFEQLTQNLLEATYRRAMAMIRSRRSVVDAVAHELLTEEDEQVSGARIRQLLEQTPVDAEEEELLLDTVALLTRVGPQFSSAGEATFSLTDSGGRSGSLTFLQQQPPLEMPDADMLKAAQVVVGRLDVSEVTGPQAGRSKAELVREQVERLKQRQQAAGVYAAASNGSEFPPPPLDEEVDYEGLLLSQWMPAVDRIEIQ